LTNKISPTGKPMELISSIRGQHAGLNAQDRRATERER